MTAGPTAPVRQVGVPASARTLSTLARIDYEDAFLVTVPQAEARTAERWARTMFDDIPTSLRLQLWSSWQMIGLKLASPWSERSILGWEVRHTDPDTVLLGADSRIGMPGELLLQRQRDTLLFDTFVQQRNLLARAVWAGIEAPHRRIVPTILRRLACRASLPATP